MLYKLGLKPPRPDSIKMKFSSYFMTAELPAVPTVFGRPWLVRNWGMLGNDREGDCYWAGAGHETMMLSADAGVSVPMFTTGTALKDYHAATGPDDNGTDLQIGCAYRQKTGIADIMGRRHMIDIYTALRPGDLTELEQAVYFLGFAGVGVELPSDAEDQFKYGEVWTVNPKSSLIGAHYIPCIGRNSLGNWLFVTWGRLQAATSDWVQEYMDQGVAILSRERLKESGLSPQGFDITQLEYDYHGLTGA